MKNFDKLSDNKHKIDLISLNNFLIEKGDNRLENLIKENKFIKRKDITKEFFENNIIKIFENNYSGEYNFVGNDFPVEWYSEYVILTLRNYFYVTRSLLYLNSDIKDYYKYCEEGVLVSGDALQYIDLKYIDYSLCEKAVKGNSSSLGYVPDNLKDYKLCYLAVSTYSYALIYVPKDIKNYYSLVKIAFESSPGIVYQEWFPREYIPQLRKDFPNNTSTLDVLNNLNLQEYISREVRKLLKEFYLKR